MARVRTTGAGHEREREEGYLASISDLMAALIFVFILTVAVFALRLAQTTQQVESLLSNVAVTRADLLEEVKNRLVERGIEVYIERDQGVLRIRENGIFFQSGAAWPAGEYARNVGKIARVLGEVLPCYVDAEDREQSVAAAVASRPAWCVPEPAEPLDCGPRNAYVETVLIEGHTDPQPIRGGFRDNLDLSSARAGQVFRMMTECEPRLEGLYNSSKLRVLGVSGYADRRPVANVDAENRRIDLRFMMELPELEGRTPGTASEVMQDVAEGLSR